MKNPLESFMKKSQEKIPEVIEKSPEDVWAEISKLGRPFIVEKSGDSEFEGGKDLKMNKNIPEDLK
ncbi:MAG: hypothetical protein WCT42_03705 [Candidatus Paceibacterota bacterium]